MRKFLITDIRYNLDNAAVAPEDLPDTMEVEVGTDEGDITDDEFIDEIILDFIYNDTGYYVEDFVKEEIQ